VCALSGDGIAGNTVDYEPYKKNFVLSYFDASKLSLTQEFVSRASGLPESVSLVLESFAFNNGSPTGDYSLRCVPPF
jgi:hypothetical protein